MEKLDLGIETFRIVNRFEDAKGVKVEVDDFVKEDPFQHAFFNKQISVEGLEEFHLTIQGGCTDEVKRELLDEVIATWDVKGEPITDL